MRNFVLLAVFCFGLGLHASAGNAKDVKVKVSIPTTLEVSKPKQGAGELEVTASIENNGDTIEFSSGSIMVKMTVDGKELDKATYSFKRNIDARLVKKGEKGGSNRTIVFTSAPSAGTVIMGEVAVLVQTTKQKVSFNNK